MQSLDGPPKCLIMPPYPQRFFNIETVGIVTVILSVLVAAYLLYSIW
jgi:hypothetical protein